MDFNTVINHEQKLAELRSTLPYRILEREEQLGQFKNPPKAWHTCIWLLGGIGDHILSIPLAEAINSITGDVVIYSRMPDITSYFTDLPVWPEKLLTSEGRDWFISLATLPMFHFARNFRGFKNPKMNDVYIRHREFASDPEWASIILHHPQLDNEMAIKAVQNSMNRVSLPFEAMGIPYDGQVLTKDFGQFQSDLIVDRYITVHDGFDTAKEMKQSRSTKNWDLLHWAWLTREIKKSYPKLMIVQLGSKASRTIPGCDLYMLGEQWADSMNTLAGSKLHIDGESGLVHAAHAFDVRSLVMFGPTNPDFFGYQDNINITPTICGGCWWLSDDSWMAKCPVGYSVPVCMQSISPVTVFLKFKEHYESL